MTLALGRIADGLASLGLRVAMAAVAAIVALILTEIVLRSGFGTSLLIVEEMVGYLMSTVVFAGLAPAARSGAMIRVDALVAQAPARARPILTVAMQVMTLLLAGALGLFVLRSLLRFEERGTLSSGVWPIPLWVPEAAALFGLLLFATVLALGVIAPAKAEETRDG
ncbi:MAG: TRAP transporter small permease [Pseudomonadota bacterium]